MRPLSINQIFSASSKIMENAQDLIEETELLLKNNKNARAFALMLYPMLCNDVQRDGAKPNPDLAFGLFCYVPLHKIWYGILR